MAIFKKQIIIDNERIITLETGKLAKQADGSVLLRYQNTMLLATVVSAKEIKEGADFLPLQVEYKEKFASTGKIPGGFLKREGRPSDNEILISRLVDRALRPLLPKDYYAETFVTISLMSADKDILPDAFAGLVASAAIGVSDIPFETAMSEVRVGKINGELKINPTATELKISTIDIMVGGTIDSIVMVEGEMEQVSEEEMIEAIEFAHIEIKKHCKAQIEFFEEVNNLTKRTYKTEDDDENFRELVLKETYNKIYDAARKVLAKKQRKEEFDNIKQEFANNFIKEDDEQKEFKTKLLPKYFHDTEKEAVRNLILNEKTRLDGRKPNEIRNISSEIDILPSSHGSALFTRGETQSLTTVTLGTKLDEKMIDEPLLKGYDKFILHYNFPPFSTGDAKASRGISRREIGHGNLAYRAVKKMVPQDETNPYTIRVVSDILESNGSSSMATVCAATLALMDAGIKMKKPVSGIAMGLITDSKTDNYVVLSDILGDEDHLGDMDFKVTGTEIGITACQMDIKIKGISAETLKVALNQAKEGRMFILSKMLETIDKPRDDYKQHAPRIISITIPKEMIGAVIGPGGKVIQEIQAKTNTTINIEEVEKGGLVLISATNGDSIKAAEDWVKRIVTIPEVGDVYNAKVKSIMEYGAFVEFLPGKEGLLHISEIDNKRVNDVKDVLKEGEMIDVKIVGIDPRTGKFKLSRKVLLNRENI